MSLRLTCTAYPSWTLARNPAIQSPPNAGDINKKVRVDVNAETSEAFPAQHEKKQTSRSNR